VSTANISTHDKCPLDEVSTICYKGKLLTGVRG